MPRILIVEDNLMIADMVEDTLASAGYTVSGIASTVQAALAITAIERPDLALIDIRLADGDLGTDLAARLAPFGQLGILYASANDGGATLSSVDGHACLAKPYQSSDLLCALEIVSHIVAGTEHRLTHPRSFHILPAAASSLATPPGVL